MRFSEGKVTSMSSKEEMGIKEGVMVNFMSTGLNYSLQTPAQTHLVITVKVFLDEISIKINRLSKADNSPVEEY